MGDEDHTLPMANIRTTQRPSPACSITLVSSWRRTVSAWNARFPSWRSGIAGFSILAVITLILNISALIWTATHLDDGHYATIVMGSYERISTLSARIHLGINILSTMLLAGSNYCMQCLMSPTRKDVDKAHARGTYLNIGILSWRNVMACSKKRLCISALLLTTSIALRFT